MSEADLYPLVQGWIEAEFPLVRAGPRKASHREVLITAQLDWIDGGTWMRPDLALIHVHRRRFDPSPTLDLYTFEVKPPGAKAIPGLHQTLAQGRIGDFVVFVLPLADGAALEVEQQATRFGVGLVTFEDPKLWRSYEMRVQPQRMSPDPDLRDQFLGRALEQAGGAAEVLAWLGVEPQP